MNMWTGNKALDDLRNKAASSPTGVIEVSVEQLNKILPSKFRTREEAEQNPNANACSTGDETGAVGGSKNGCGDEEILRILHLCDSGERNLYFSQCNKDELMQAFNAVVAYCKDRLSIPEFCPH